MISTYKRRLYFINGFLKKHNLLGVIISEREKGLQQRWRRNLLKVTNGDSFVDYLQSCAKSELRFIYLIERCLCWDVTEEGFKIWSKRNQMWHESIRHNCKYLGIQDYNIPMPLIKNNLL